ncbi:hypothetical protein BDV96DRAFT_647010 [Lophiotrema nucula]|uniref:Uncharacterized protein n=1 Tax=Lophiotrema nucula TaxID=690887 RepID=A0A6A5Z5J5_9PLEO|nr:hypothetical protein BDV96DRAFT_647010 [Lophiotrema nucula]
MPFLRQILALAAFTMVVTAAPVSKEDIVARAPVADAAVAVERNPLSNWDTPLPPRDAAIEPRVQLDLK